MSTPRIAALLTLTAALLTSPAHAAENLIPEGTFETGLGYSGVPEGWDIEPGDWRNKSDLSLKIMSEDASPDAEGKNYLRLANSGSPDNGMFRLKLSVLLPIPAPSKITISWRIRAQIDELSGAVDWSSIQCPMIFIDNKGRDLGMSNGALRLTRSTAGRWLERETTVDLPAGTEEITLMPGLYLIKGTVDFDDISITAAE